MVDPFRGRRPVDPQRVGLWAKAGMRVRHGRRIAADVDAYATSERLWWLVPLIVGLALVAAALVTTQVALPVAVYTLF